MNNGGTHCNLDLKKHLDLENQRTVESDNERNNVRFGKYVTISDGESLATGTDDHNDKSKTVEIHIDERSRESKDCQSMKKEVLTKVQKENERDELIDQSFNFQLRRSQLEKAFSPCLANKNKDLAKKTQDLSNKCIANKKGKKISDFVFAFSASFNTKFVFF